MEPAKTKESLEKSNTLIISDPTFAGSSYSKLRDLLQKTLYIDELFDIFSTELAKTLKFKRITYTHSELGLFIEKGVKASNKISYELSLDNSSLGKLELEKIDEFKDNELKIIERFKACFLFPIRNAIQYYIALHESFTCPLTKLSNRRALDGAIKRECDLAKRHNNHLALTLIDIDDFKAINDDYGHQAGDVALQHLAKVLINNARLSDLIFRYGGEEFVILLRQTTLESALQVAERIRQDIEYIVCKHQNYNFKFTASIGVAMYSREDCPKSIFKKADKALYSAKNNGKNCVIGSL